MQIEGSPDVGFEEHVIVRSNEFSHLLSPSQRTDFIDGTQHPKWEGQIICADRNVIYGKQGPPLYSLVAKGLVATCEGGCFECVERRHVKCYCRCHDVVFDVAERPLSYIPEGV